MRKLKAFIVEDDHWYADFLAYQVGLNPDFEAQTFHDAASFKSLMHEKPDVITLDYTLPDVEGSELVDLIRKELPDTYVIIISGQNDVSVALHLLQNGVFDYLVKDNDMKDRLWNTLLKIQEHKKLKDQVESLQHEVQKKYDFSKSIIGIDACMKPVFNLLEKACQSKINVSITGETGTGKELIAKAIHYHSAQKKGPFVAINVSAIPKELIESELFGHEKGAFTGASNSRIGKFEEANGGTLFLDEIGEMDLLMQVKLLRVLQEREIVRLGDNKAIKVNCRIITATHRDLKKEVAEGRFREDLYYRLMGLPIHLPPLRERKNDLVALCKHFIQLFANENDFEQKQLSEGAIKQLMSYPFPGNIRELKSIIDLAMVLSDSAIIEHEHILLPELASKLNFAEREMTLREMTNQLIGVYLKKYDNNIQKVADLLDIGKSTIYRLIKENEIQIN